MSERNNSDTENMEKKLRNKLAQTKHREVKTFKINILIHLNNLKKYRNGKMRKKRMCDCASGSASWKNKFIGCAVPTTTATVAIAR